MSPMRIRAVQRMIIVFTGKGKGKTTSAIGQGVRAIGQGKKVLMIQFIKSKEFFSGEDKAVKKFGRKFRLIKSGKGFVGIMGDKLSRNIHQKAAKKALEKAKKAILSKKFDLIILDEVNVALSLRLIKLKDVLKVINLSLKGKDIILTGRGAGKELIKRADLATEFKEIKHPFKKGRVAKQGLEF